MEEILGTSDERVIIIPDIHDRVIMVDYIIKQEKPTRVVSLGDWFDSWTGTPADAQITAEYLKSRTSNWDLILGNHDLSYGWAMKCSGWAPEKQRRVNAIMEHKDWSRFISHVWVGPYLCTHAGLHKHFYNGGKGLDDYLDSATDQIRERIGGILPDPLFGAGYDRGGNQRYGGILWCDWSQLQPPAKLKQICGHTPGAEVRFKNNGDVICLDTALNDYAIWNGENLEVKHLKL